MPLMNKPIAYERMGKLDEALEGYQKFMEVFPDDAEGFYGIGRIYHLKGDYENGLDHMMKAYVMYNKEKSPYARDAEANLGIMYRELKQKSQLELFDRMAKKNNIQIGGE